MQLTNKYCHFYEKGWLSHVTLIYGFRMLLPNQQKALVFWSSGKDACLALHQTLKVTPSKTVGLITTFSETSKKVAFHGTPLHLVEEQAKSLSLSLAAVALPETCPNEDYEKILTKELLRQKKLGVTELIFGDLFLEDIRRYRESFLKPLGFELSFPLWNLDTRTLAQEFNDLGYQAIVTAVDSQKLPEKFVGQVFDEDLRKCLPLNIDPCGENGEFHTFVFDGPLFKTRINFNLQSFQ